MDEYEFEELGSKLNENSDTLLQILDEQLRSNIAIENIGDEISFSNERICHELIEVYGDGLFTIHIGNGGSAQQVNLGMPKMNNIFL